MERGPSHELENEELCIPRSVSRRSAAAQAFLLLTSVKIYAQSLQRLVCELSQ